MVKYQGKLLSRIPKFNFKEDLQYSMPSAMVKAISRVAVAPASCMW